MVNKDNDPETMIRLGKSRAGTLRAMGQKGESYDDIITRLLDKTKINVAVDSDLYGFLLQIVQDTEKGAEVVDVSSALAETVVKLGAVSGFRGENFRDWGVQAVAKATMITFLGIDNRFTLLSTMMAQAMNTLVAELGATELAPVLEQALEAIASAFARLYPEEGG